MCGLISAEDINNACQCHDANDKEPQRGAWLTTQAHPQDASHWLSLISHKKNTEIMLLLLLKLFLFLFQ